MYHTTERNERLARRHALVLAIAFHLSLVAMLYFKLTSDPVESNTRPTKVNVAKDQPTASVQTVQLP